MNIADAEELVRRPTMAGFVRGSSTSKEAAESIAGDLARLQSEVLTIIRCSGHRGMTTDEIETVSGLKHQTASARVVELRKKKLIFDSGRRRPTRSGRGAVVYVVEGT